jgi:pimeloyl-ACP methyl ester carboxylesterase
MFILRAALALTVTALPLVYGTVRAEPSTPAAAQAPAPIRFTVVDQGTVGKPDVILLPGLTSGRWVWEAQAAKLAPDYRLHLLQVNGFAGQPAGANATADPLLPALVEDLHAYIVTRRMRPIIVGHSLGGLLGLMLAAKYPQDVARLVIVDASPFWGLMFGPTVTADSVRPMAQSMRDGTFSASPARREASERSIAQGLALDPQARRRIMEDGLASDAQVGGRAMYEDLTTDLRPALASIKTPTLVIYAYDPTLVFPDGTRPTAEAADAAYQSSYRTLPNVKLVRIDNARHFIMSDQPERLDEQLRRFLETTGVPHRR